MVKFSEPVITVDSVEDAIKFYTEKLGFDIVDLVIDNEAGKRLGFARLRKGKCYIRVKTPKLEESADFTIIKHCPSRCVGVHVELKKGLDKYFLKYQKKGVKILQEPKDCPTSGMRFFSCKDPFGVKFIFCQPIEDSVKLSLKLPDEIEVCGKKIKKSKLKDPNTIEDIVLYLKKFGILRRYAKKFAKLKIK